MTIAADFKYWFRRIDGATPGANGEEWIMNDHVEGLQCPSTNIVLCEKPCIIGRVPKAEKANLDKSQIISATLPKAWVVTSATHAVIKMKETGDVEYTDLSSNGSYLQQKSTDGEKFQHVNKQTVNIQPGDVIALFHEVRQTEGSRYRYRFRLEEIPADVASSLGLMQRQVKVPPCRQCRGWMSKYNAQMNHQNALQNEIAELKAQNTDLKANNSNLEAELKAKTVSTSAEVQRELEAARHELTRLRDTVESTQANLRQATIARDEAQSSLQGVEQEVTRLATEHESLRLKMKAAEENLRNARADRDSFKADLVTLRSDHVALQKEMASREHELNRVIPEVIFSLGGLSRVCKFTKADLFSAISDGLGPAGTHTPDGPQEGSLAAATECQSGRPERSRPSAELQTPADGARGSERSVLPTVRDQHFAESQTHGSAAEPQPGTSKASPQATKTLPISSVHGAAVAVDKGRDEVEHADPLASDKKRPRSPTVGQQPGSNEDEDERANDSNEHGASKRAHLFQAPGDVHQSMGHEHVEGDNVTDGAVSGDPMSETDSDGTSEHSRQDCEDTAKLRNVLEKHRGTICK